MIVSRSGMDVLVGGSGMGEGVEGGGVPVVVDVVVRVRGGEHNGVATVIVVEGRWMGGEET